MLLERDSDAKESLTAESDDGSYIFLYLNMTGLKRNSSNQRLTTQLIEMLQHICMVEKKVNKIEYQLLRMNKKYLSAKETLTRQLTMHNFFLLERYYLMLKNDCQQNQMMFPICYYLLNMTCLKRKFFQSKIDNTADIRYVTRHMHGWEKIK